MERCWAINKNAVRVGKEYLGAELLHLHIVDGATFVYPVMDERAAFCLSRHRYEIWQIVDIDTWIRTRGDFFRRRVKFAVFEREVDELGAAIFCNIFF